MLIPNIASAAVFANTSARFRENAPFGWRPTGNQGIGTTRCYYEDDRSWEAWKVGKNKKMGRWEAVKLGVLEGEKVGRWEAWKVGNWEAGKMRRWVQSRRY
jgi:hypothetical protein